MYKLVVVGGKLRGKEFILQEGDTIFGRDPSCDVELSVSGVSKNHFTITINEQNIFIEDMGSSNGVFVNSKLIKSMELKDGDKIALPDLIMQVIYVKEKKIIVDKEDDEDDTADYLTGGHPPKNIVAKIVWLFKYKLMPVIHGINEEYEWRVLIAIVLTLFIVVTIALTIFPVLQDSKNLLLFETAKRGKHYAEEIARLNARALEQKNLDRVDTGFLNTEDGVKSYELFDLDGRIVRPLSLLNEYISDPFSVKAHQYFSGDIAGNKKESFISRLGNGQIGIARKISAYNARMGYFEPVGVIAIRFSPKSLAIEAAKNQKAYAEALATSALIAILFFGIVYYLTIRPLEEMRFQIEEVLRGRKKELESNYLMTELNPLRNTINSLLQRLRELQNSDEAGEFDELEEDTGYVNSYIEVLEGAAGPAMVLNSEKLLKKMNLEAEDLTGIRETASIDMELLDISREKGFAATIIELCDLSANNGGTSQKGEYDIQGHDYLIYVSALIGKDSFAKAFYISFVKN